MQAVAELAGVEQMDHAAIQQWAAEDYAISLGLLRECPYHGEPFQTRSPLRLRPLTTLMDGDGAIYRVFHGDMGALLAAANRAARRYGECCELCAASAHDEFD